MTIACCPFAAWPVVPGVVLYCDPPYAATTGYKGADAFEHSTFWARAEEWSSAESYVFVSEENAPAGWAEVWTKQRKQQIGANNVDVQRQRTEKLFFKGPAHLKGITW